jgi:hypothetical protein
MKRTGFGKKSVTENKIISNVIKLKMSVSFHTALAAKAHVAGGVTLKL